MARPSTPLLSPARIAAAALDLVREEGDFTVGALAARLGVNAASLYHHAPGGRAEIIDLMREAIHGAIEVDDIRDSGASPRERLDLWAERYREGLRRASAFAPVYFGVTAKDRGTHVLYDVLIRILADAGVPLEERLAMATLVDFVVVGSIGDERSPVPLWDGVPADLEALAEVSPRFDTAERSAAGYRLAMGVVLDRLDRYAEDAKRAAVAGGSAAPGEPARTAQADVAPGAVEG